MHAPVNLIFTLFYLKSIQRGSVLYTVKKPQILSGGFTRVFNDIKMQIFNSIQLSIFFGKSQQAHICIFGR